MSDHEWEIASEREWCYAGEELAQLDEQLRHAKRPLEETGFEVRSGSSWGADESLGTPEAVYEYLSEEIAQAVATARGT